MTFAARYFKKGTSPLAVCWLVSAVCFGMFYELLSAAFSAVIAGILVYKIIKNGAQLRLGLMPAAVLAVFLGYIFTCFWAVDTGAALSALITQDATATKNTPSVCVSAVTIRHLKPRQAARLPQI